jgi:hypothetical protein
LSYINYEKSTGGALPGKVLRGLHDTWNYGDSALMDCTLRVRHEN